MNKLFRNVVLVVISPIWKIVGHIIPKNDGYIVINSVPDFDDTTRAIASEAANTGKTLYILCKSNQRPDWLKKPNIKIAYTYSLRGIWYYHRAKYIFYTNALFCFWPRSSRQVIINVWHGMPIKCIGTLSEKEKYYATSFSFDFTIAIDSRFQSIIAEAFGVDKSKVLLSPHPRLEGMLIAPKTEQLFLPPHNHLCIWLPTHRQQANRHDRIDGCLSGDVVCSGADLSTLDELFRKHGCVCIVKPHPLAKLPNKEVFSKYTNIVYIDEKLLAASDNTIYQLLGAADFLITDVSSVYLDYKLLKRPVVVFCPDLDAYEKSVGFVAPIETLIEEKTATTEEEFLRQTEVLLSTLQTQNNAATNSFEGKITKKLFEMIGIV